MPDQMELPNLAAVFTYDGIRRHIENVTIEWGGENIPPYRPTTIIGMERRKGGKFSNRIKRYTIGKCGDMRIYFK